MAIVTLIRICSYSVPWILDKKDLDIIMRNRDLSVREIVSKLWTAAFK